MWDLHPQTTWGIWEGFPALACCPPPLRPIQSQLQGVRLEEEVNMISSVFVHCCVFSTWQVVNA